VANGGTGATSFSPNNYLIRTNSSGVFDTSAIFEAGGNVGIAGKLIIGNDEGAALNVKTTAYAAYFTSSGNSANIPLNVANLATTGSNLLLSLYTDNYIERASFRYDRPGNRTQLVSTGNGLAITGEVLITGLVGTGSRAVNAAADGTLSAASSITIKENINNLNYGLNKILQLQPKSFNYIDKNKYGEGLDIGFIAEDVYPIVPEATGTMNDGFIYFDAVKLIPILTKAIQEQNLLIKALEQRILTLENK
jgi:hypothetical protein